jgi:chemotaxis protein CheD
MSKKPALIQTVLGSCVSVCLWDKERRLGVMNHFVYPSIRVKSKATPVYGNIATRAAIRMMEQAGSDRSSMEAHILGGAHPGVHPANNPANNTGKKNISIARKVLALHGINVASEDVGGTMGRKIVFDTDSGHVAVLKVYKIRESDWYE